MKIPGNGDTIYILGLKTTFVVDEKYCDKNNVDGMADPEQNRIIIRDFSKSSFAFEKQLQIILHECMHIYNSILGLQSGAQDAEEYVEPATHAQTQIFLQLMGVNND